jgi:ATP-binding cassette, subfamily F, member 1
MIFNEEVSITLGNKTLITPSLVQIQQNEKYCIIGPNGVGKTTLINHIYDKIKETYNALYVTQSEKVTDDCSIYQYMLKADQNLFSTYTRFCELEKIMNENNEEISDDLFNEYKVCSEQLNSGSFLRYNAKVKEILNGLGFLYTDVQIKLLSGGQHSKLSLGRALLLEPELLLLDEPTNHLDLSNILWLEKYLANYKKSLILISHNIDFFDNIANKLIYFFNIDAKNPKVYTCKGGYDNFLKVFNQKRKDYVNEYEKYCKKIKELKKKNTPENKKKLDELEKHPINRPIRDFDIHIKFNEVGYISSSEYTNIITFDNVDFRYEEKPVLKNITVGVSMKSRYVLIGDNGSGKSTFFKLCQEQLAPDSGEITRDMKLRIGYFNQHSISEMDETMTPMQYLKSIDNSLSEQDCRKTLAQVGFKKMYEGDMFDVGKLLISELSGGQKVKIVLCGIKIRNPHIILFDEPTNHLDIYSIDQFIEAINEYNGGVIIITHDRYIIENIENYELLMLKDNVMARYNGTFNDYCDELEHNDE